MYIEKPQDLLIRDAKLQFVSNFSGKPFAGNSTEGTRSIDIKIESLEDAENLAALGWPVKIYYRGPVLESRDETKQNRDKVRELMKRSCLTFDERRAFLIDRNEYSTEYVDFYIKGIISYRYADKAAKVYMIMPVQKTKKLMTELNVGKLDNAKIVKLDVLLNPSWNSRRNEYSAYVKECNVVIEESPFVNDYEDYTLIENDDEAGYEE